MELITELRTPMLQISINDLRLQADEKQGVVGAFNLFGKQAGFFEISKLNKENEK